MTRRPDARTVGNRRMRAHGRQRPAGENDALSGLLNAAIGLKFDPAESALRKLIADNDRAPGALDRAFGHYRDTLAAAQGSVKDAYDQAVSRNQQATNAAATAVTASAAGMDQGATPQGAIDQHAVADDFAKRLAAVNAAYGINQAGQIDAARGQAAAGLGLAGTEAESRHAQALGAVLKRGNDLRDQMQALQGQKGDYAVDLARQLQDTQFQQDVASRTLGLKEKDSARDYLLAKLKLRQDADQFGQTLDFKNHQLDVNDANADADRAQRDSELQARIDNWQREAGQRDRELDIKELAASGHGGLSHAQQQAYSQRKAKIKALSKAFRTEMASGHYKNTGEVFTSLRRRFGFSRQELEMARDLAVLGYLGDRGLAAATGYFPAGVVPKGFRQKGH